MVDTTSIFPELNSDEGSLDLFNVSAVVWVVVYLVILAIFGGTQPFNFNEILASAIYFFIIGAGVMITLIAQSRYGNIFTSETSTVTQATLYVGFTIATFFLVTGSLLGAGEITIFGNSFASFTANLEPYHKAHFVINIAPIAETVIAFAGTFLITGFMLDLGLRKKLPGGGFTVAFLASIPISILFAIIHDSEGARISGAFFIRAFVVMLLSMFIIFSEELTDTDYLPFASIMAVAIAVHRALNIISYGGYQAYFQDIMTAPMPHLVLSYWWLLFDLIWVFILAFGLGKIVAEIIDPNDELDLLDKMRRLFAGRNK